MSKLTAIDIWRKELEHCTITEAVILLRNLGSYQFDKVMVLLRDARFRGYRQFAFCDLLDYISEDRFCRHVHPVYFTGGPGGDKQFKGTLLTMVIDRVILASVDKGPTFAFKAVDYARSFRTRRIPVGERLTRPSDSCTRDDTRRVLGLA
jgi:hypothetical protein